jgi:hypothetical protein
MQYSWYHSRYIAVMMRVLVIIASLCALTPEDAYAGHFPDAESHGGNCDPAADPRDDASQPDPRLRSCVGQSITAENYEIRVCWDFADPFGSGCEDVKVGKTEILVGVPVLELVYAEIRREGDQACGYVKAAGFVNFGLKRAEIDDEVRAAAQPGRDHCYFLPSPPVSLQPPQWSEIISPVCTDYTQAVSKRKDSIFDWEVPFSAAIVQCVEDTFYNIFLKEDTYNETIFSKMQKRLEQFVLGWLTLYIMLIGYRVVMERKIFSKSEMQWYILRFALVVYFALGTGIKDVLPMLQESSKDLSRILMEANFGTDGDYDAAQAAVDAAQSDYDAADMEVLTRRGEYDMLQHAFYNATPLLDGTVVTEAMVTQAQRDLALADVALDEARHELNVALSEANAFGYQYCDFGGEDYTTTNTDINGNTVTRNMQFMQLWDMVDCKVAKLLGVGMMENSVNTPKLLVMGPISIFTRPLGIPIFIFVVTFLVYICMVVVRVVYVYIIATIALSILGFFGPLVIPASLFKYTRKMFDAWFKQMVSYTLQPVILFAFLAFLFGAYDFVLYEDNHIFYQRSDAEVVASPTLVNQIILDAEGECPDKDALGCIIQQTELKEIAEIFGLTLGYPDFNSVGEELQFVLGLLKLIVISAIGYVVLGRVTELASRLTDAAGGGAASQVPIGVASPIEIGKAAGHTAAGIVKLPATIGSGLAKRNKSAAARRKAKRAAIAGGKGAMRAGGGGAAVDGAKGTSKSYTIGQKLGEANRRLKLTKRAWKDTMKKAASARDDFTRAVSATCDTMKSSAAMVVKVVKNPKAAALALTAGAVKAVNRARKEVQESISNTVTAMEEDAKSRIDSAKAGIRSGITAMQDAGRAVLDAPGNMMRAARQKVSDARDATVDAFNGAVDGVKGAGRAAVQGMHDMGDAMGRAATAVREAPGKAMDSARDSFNGAVESVKGAGRAMAQGAHDMKDAMGRAATAIKEAPGNALRSARDSMQQGVASMRESLGRARDSIASAPARMAASARQTMSDARQSMAAGWEEVKSAPGRAYTSVTTSASDAWASTKQGISDSYHSAVDSVRTAPSRAMHAVSDSYHGAVDSFHRQIDSAKSDFRAGFAAGSSLDDQPVAPSRARSSGGGGVGFDFGSVT